GTRSMNFWKGLVLDFRTLLGALIPNSNILSMLLRYEAEVDFRTPRVCLQLAARTIEQTLERRGLDPAIGSSALEQLSRLVAPIDPEVCTTSSSTPLDRGWQTTSLISGRWSPSPWLSRM